MEYSLIELFAGAGGLALGLEKAGLNNKLLIEIDKDAVETLKINRPNWNIIKDDVSNVSFKETRADVVVGGFPCQPFSVASTKRLGFNDPRGMSFFHFARCVEEVQPKIFLFENVKGLVNHDSGNTLKLMRSILKNLGYTLHYRIFNALKFNVPQSRERLILVGVQSGMEFEFPAQSEQILTLRDTIRNVPFSMGFKYTQEKFKVLDLVPEGGCWKNLPPDVQKKYLKLSSTGDSYITGNTIARRLSWDKPSPTLTTRPVGKFIEYCHPSETRPLNIREYARIQTFPDSWKFNGSLSSQYKQIGNAVPVEFAYKLGCSIATALNQSG